MIRVNLKANCDQPSELLKKFHLEAGGKVQETVDRCVIEYSKPYCPKNTGILEGSPYTMSPPGSGKVIYYASGGSEDGSKTSYARYLYYGVVYGPNFPIYDETGALVGWRSRKNQKKHRTGRELKYNQEKNHLAGSFWVARMKADKMKLIEEVANRVARS